MDTQLASRGNRFIAAVIDGVISSALSGLAFATPGLSPNMAISASILMILILAIVQMVLLTQKGQTMGKMAMHIMIVRADTGQNGGFMTNVVMRVFVNSLLFVVPFYFIVDVLFIFREDMRCIHDMIANTRVVNANTALTSAPQPPAPTQPESEAPAAPPPPDPEIQQ